MYKLLIPTQSHDLQCTYKPCSKVIATTLVHMVCVYHLFIALATQIQGLDIQGLSLDKMLIFTKGLTVFSTQLEAVPYSL